MPADITMQQLPSSWSLEALLVYSHSGVMLGSASEGDVEMTGGVVRQGDVEISVENWPRSRVVSFQKWKDRGCLG
jgi:hypothetical protein